VNGCGRPNSWADSASLLTRERARRGLPERREAADDRLLRSAGGGQHLGSHLIAALEQTATGYDRQPGIKWSSGDSAPRKLMAIGYNPTSADVGGREGAPFARWSGQSPRIARRMAVLPSPRQRCHSTPALAVNGGHSLGIYTVILL
jgi:hypothetical protein